MGLLYPGALALLAVVPLLVLAYLARERPARVTVSSVLAFRALRGLRAERYGGRPRFDWTFLVELLILCLAVLAVAGPYLLRPSRPIAIVLDNSATMQARLGTGETRFEQAAAKLSEALGRHSDATEISAYVTAPQPHRIAPPFGAIGEAQARIARVEPVDAPADGAAVANLLTSLIAERRYEKIIYAGGQPVAAPDESVLEAIVVEAPARNHAIGSFVLRREAFGARELHARLRLANFADEARALEVVVSGDGQELGRANVELGAGETGQLEFPALPAARVYRAELSPGDAFELDNVAFAAAGDVKAVSIVFVSPTPGESAGLESIPGVAVTTRTPENYMPDELARADLVIFQYAAPKELPRVNALFVMPPPGDPALAMEVAPAEAIEITGWQKTDALTDSVNFRLLNVRAGEYLGPHPWMTPVVTGAGGALLLRGERDGHRYVAAGFNLFPYLGSRNLPMSVLTLNVLSYLAGLGADSAGYRTGQPWIVPAGIEQVIGPGGAAVEVSAGSLFTETSRQGVYELVSADGERMARAVNLADFAASNLESATPIQVAAPAGDAPVREATERMPLAPYVIAAIIALLALEAAIIYRRKRRLGEAQA